MTTSVLAKVQDKVAELVHEGDEILRELVGFAWEDNRPERIPENYDPDWPEISWGTPELRRVPPSFVRRCNNWYTSCVALLEVNMANRRSDLPPLLKFLHEHEYISESEQHALAMA